MSGLLGCLRAEWTKVRRSPALLVTVVSPYVVVLVVALFAFLDGERFLTTSGRSAWRWLAETVLTLWSLVVLPLVAALVASHSVRLESEALGFKHLFALPVARWKILSSKAVLSWGFNALSFALLGVGVLAAGLLLRISKQGLGFEEPVPLIEISAGISAAALASLFLVSLLWWIALERSRLVGPIGFTLLALVVLVALRSLGSDLEVFHPFSYPSLAVEAWQRGEPSWFWKLAGSGGGLAFSLVAGAGFVRRDVTH